MVKSRDELFKEIERVRAEAQESKELRPRAYESVEEMLVEAVCCLHEEDTVCWRSLAGYKIGMARKRIGQAEDQNIWLGAGVGLFLVALAGLAAWGIYEFALWPKLDLMPEGCVLLGSVLWGIVGSAISGLCELHTRLSRQQFDSNRFAWYVTHPAIGAGIGGILFLLVYSGLLVTGQEGPFNPSVPFVLAACAGFEQTYVILFLRAFLKKRLKAAEDGPEELG